MEKYGVKTRSSEQAMVPVEAYISMVTGSSSEEDSKTDDQSYIPPEVYALKTLFSLQIFPSPIQMADAQEEQLNIQTLSTKAMRNTKKRTT